ncbi:unnamed protein product [Closterium sp. NIES-65]|nr:unnamed protein product [Closterium sp. NIES-65]
MFAPLPPLSSLPVLLEHNPDIAVCVLPHPPSHSLFVLHLSLSLFPIFVIFLYPAPSFPSLLHHSSPSLYHSHRYLEVLPQLSLTLHSLEVVGRVAMAVDLPLPVLDFNLLPLSPIPPQDKSMQNRLVRIVCIFLLSLIRDNIINVEALFIEMQAFCIEYSRVREAAALFRMLKSLE